MYILFDLGKTKLRVAKTADRKNITDISIFETPETLEEALKLLIEHGEKISEGNITGFVGGITATLDKSRGKNAEEVISKKTGMATIVGNDSAIVGLGEAIYGAGRGYKVVQYITVSSGIGGARIEAQRLDKTSRGFEPGHQIIDYKNNITLQNLVSGSSIKEKYNKNPKEIPEPEFWKDLSKILAVGVYNSILHWMPEVVVLGGSMITGDPAIPVSDMEEQLKKINKILEKIPPVKKAELGDHGGLYGALAFLNQSNNEIA